MANLLGTIKTEALSVYFMLKPLKIAICATPLLAATLLPNVVAASIFHQTPSGAVQTTIAQAPGLGLSNINFVQTTDAEKEVRGWALKIEGTLTNFSGSAIQARAVTYNIIAFNGQRYEVIVTNSEFLSPRMEPVTLAPGASIPFVHSLDERQMAAMSRFALAPDIFRYQVVGVTNEVISKLPAHY